MRRLLRTLLLRTGRRPVVAALVAVAAGAMLAARFDFTAVDRVTADDGTAVGAELPPSSPAAPADKSPADAESAKSSSRGNRSPMPAFTPEREAAAVAFVSANHPELAPLLAHLKLSRPNEYQKAIRKLFGDSERLANSRDVHPRRYELELQEWKLESRAQLLVAKLTMSRTPELEQQLRRVLTEQLDVQREILSLERERLAQRVAALDKELSKLDDNRDERLEERLQRALKSAAGQKKQPAKSEDKN